MMMSMRTIGLVVLVLASGCGPRLRPAADAPVGAAAAANTPVAKMSVRYEDAKLDTEHKYTADGQFTVGGLFYKDGEPTDAVVKVSLKNADGVVSRAYEIDLAPLAGASAKVEMWDDGLLTVVIPPGDAPKPGFETSNPNIKAASLEQPGQAPSTCYFGKEVLDGKIRFALCELQTEAPRLAFVDAVPEAPAGNPAPAGEPAPAETPGTEPPAAPKAN
jgi:hypothetical protein